MPQEVRYDGVHCHFVIQRFPRGVVVMRIRGTDIGEFEEAPMNPLHELRAGEPFDLFIDARDVNGASIEVSGEWRGWNRTAPEIFDAELAAMLKSSQR
ncbi:MAG: hypothetical protein WDO18_03660 [Acidobacteriota bacterium]